MEKKHYKIKYSTNKMIGGEGPPCGPDDALLGDCVNRDDDGKVKDAIDHDEFITVFDDPYKLPEGHCFKKETICQWKRTKDNKGQPVTNPLTNNEIPQDYVNECLSKCDQ